MAGSLSSSAGAPGATVVEVTCIPSSLLCADGDLYTCDGFGAHDMLQAPQLASFAAVTWVANDNTQQVYAMRVTTTLP